MDNVDNKDESFLDDTNRKWYFYRGLARFRQIAGTEGDVGFRRIHLLLLAPKYDHDHRHNHPAIVSQLLSDDVSACLISL